MYRAKNEKYRTIYRYTQAEAFYITKINQIKYICITNISILAEKQHKW